MAGFAVLCSGRSSARAYVVQRKLADRRTRRITIGPEVLAHALTTGTNEAQDRVPRARARLRRGEP